MRTGGSTEHICAKQFLLSHCHSFALCHPYRLVFFLGYDHHHCDTKRMVFSIKGLWAKHGLSFFAKRQEGASEGQKLQNYPHWPYFIKLPPKIPFKGQILSTCFELGFGLQKVLFKVPFLGYGPAWSWTSWWRSSWSWTSWSLSSWLWSWLVMDLLAMDMVGHGPPAYWPLGRYGGARPKRALPHLI